MVKIMFLFQAKKKKKKNMALKEMEHQQCGHFMKDAMTKTSPLLQNVYHLFATTVSGPQFKSIAVDLRQLCDHYGWVDST